MSRFFARYGDKKLFVMMNRHILFFNNVWKTVHRGANAKNGVTTERRVFVGSRLSRCYHSFQQKQPYNNVARFLELTLALILFIFFFFVCFVFVLFVFFVFFVFVCTFIIACTRL